MTRISHRQPLPPQPRNFRKKVIEGLRKLVDLMDKDSEKSVQGAMLTTAVGCAQGAWSAYKSSSELNLGKQALWGGVSSAGVEAGKNVLRTVVKSPDPAQKLKNYQELGETAALGAITGFITGATSGATLYYIAQALPVKNRFLALTLGNGLLNLARYQLER